MQRRPGQLPGSNQTYTSWCTSSCEIEQPPVRFLTSPTLLDRGENLGDQAISCKSHAIFLGPEFRNVIAETLVRQHDETYGLRLNLPSRKSSHDPKSIGPGLCGGPGREHFRTRRQ